MTQPTQNDALYTIYADIYPDDDFDLNIGCDIVLEGFATKDAAIEALIQKLLSAKTTWAKTWSIRSTDESGEVLSESSGDHGSAWTAVRDLAIEQLREGTCSFTVGGNQTIQVWTIIRSRSKDRAYEEALLRVSPEDRNILGLRDPSSF